MTLEEQIAEFHAESLAARTLGVLALRTLLSVHSNPEQLVKSMSNLADRMLVEPSHESHKAGMVSPVTAMARMRVQQDLAALLAVVQRPE